MRLPTWGELTEEQLDVLDTPLNQSLLVTGPPGSGKTVHAIRRARMVANSAKPGQPRAALITFNRLLRRLMRLVTGREDPVEIDINTMHSFVANEYRRRLKTEPPLLPQTLHSPNFRPYDWDAMHAELTKSRCTPDRPHLVIDEGQDLPKGFYMFAARHVAFTITIFADDDQTLTSECSSLEEIREAAELSDCEWVCLKENHRSRPEVARLAEHFHHGRLPAASVRRSSGSELPALIQFPDYAAAATMVSNWYRNRGGSLGVIVHRKMDVDKVRNEIKGQLGDVRVDFYHSESNNEEVICQLDPGITVLTSRSAKGQEFDAVFLLNLEEFIPCRDTAARRMMYMLCTRARDHLILGYGPGGLSAAAIAALPDAAILARP